MSKNGSGIYVLGILFGLVAGFVDVKFGDLLLTALFVLAAARVRRFFAARPDWGRWSKRALAGVFGGLALRLAWEQKP